jgi:hypothetical protein
MLNGNARRYKLKRVTGGTTTIYTMISPQMGEVTPTGYQIVYPTAQKLAEATKTEYMSQLDLFLSKIGVGASQITSLKSSAEYAQPACTPYVYVASINTTAYSNLQNACTMNPADSIDTPLYTASGQFLGGETVYLDPWGAPFNNGVGWFKLSENGGWSINLGANGTVLGQQGIHSVWAC